MTKTKKLMKILVLFIAIVAILGAIGFRWYLDMCTFVTTEDARIAANTIRVGTKISGKLRTIPVREGDVVAAGQLLAELDNTDLELILKQAEATADAAKNKMAALLNGNRPEELQIALSKLEITRVSLQQSRDELARQKQLFEQKCIPVKNYENAVNEVDIAEKNYKVAEDSYQLLLKGARGEDRELVVNQYRQGCAARDLAEYNYNNTKVFAPISGKIVQKTVNPGEFVTAGQTLFTLINPANIWVQANIKETDISRLKLNQRVEIRADQYPGIKFQGRVQDIGITTNSTFAMLPLSNSGGNYVKVVQIIPIKIKLDTTDKLLAIGSSITVRIRLKAEG